MKIKYTKGAVKSLRKLDHQIAQRIIRKIKSSLAENPYIHRKLQNVPKDLRRYRVGKYRVIYEIPENIEEYQVENMKDNKETCLIIHVIEHRNQVYKLL